MPWPVLAEMRQTSVSPPQSAGVKAVLRQLGEDAVRVRARLIHLVDGDDDGNIRGLGVVDGLDGLGHDAVVGGHDQDGDVGAHGAAGAHLGEGGVARGVQEGDGLAVDLDGVRADVLGDAAGLAGDHVRLPDGVQQGRLAVVDVAHDDHDRGTGLELLRRVLVVVEEALLDGDDDLVLHAAAQLSGHVFGGVVVDGLVDGGKDAVLHQALDDVSLAVFFMREASSPTVISSGILTVSGVFLAISSWRRRIFSCSSLRDLLVKGFFLLPPALLTCRRCAACRRRRSASARRPA